VNLAGYYQAPAVIPFPITTSVLCGTGGANATATVTLIPSSPAVAGLQYLRGGNFAGSVIVLAIQGPMWAANGEFGINVDPSYFQIGNNAALPGGKFMTFVPPIPLAQKFFGNGPPNNQQVAEAGNLPGDIYIDYQSNNSWQCFAAPGTPSPACLGEAPGSWQQLNTGQGPVGPPGPQGVQGPDGAQGPAGASGPVTVQVAGKLVGSEVAINFTSPANAPSSIVNVCSDNPANASVDCTPSVNTAVVPTIATIQSGPVFCDSTTGTTQPFTCTLLTNSGRVLTVYTTGMFVVLRGDTANLNGGCSLNIDGIGNISIKQNDGLTDPGVGAIRPGHFYWLFYDGAVFRMQ
jgi:hypothetical protein